MTELEYTDLVLKNLPVDRYVSAKYLIELTGHKKPVIENLMYHLINLGIAKKSYDMGRSERQLYYTATGLSLDSIFKRVFVDEQLLSYNNLKALLDCDLKTVKWFVNYFHGKNMIFKEVKYKLMHYTIKKPEITNELNPNDFKKLLLYFYKMMPNLRTRQQNKWCI